MASGASSATSGFRSGPLELARLLAQTESRSPHELLEAVRTLLELDSVQVELETPRVRAPTSDEGALGSSTVREMVTIALGRAATVGQLRVAASRADFPTADERAVIQLVADRLALLFREQRALEERDRVRRVQDARAALEREERALLLSELTTVLTHDVSQPLAAIVTNANACTRWLSASAPDLDEARAAAARIAQEGHRASQVVQQIRARLRFDQGPHETSGIDEAFALLEHTLRDELESAGVALQLADSHALPDVRADLTLLRHILLNLSRNALEAMRDGIGPRTLVLKAERQGDSEVCIHVRDSGPGLGADRTAAFRAFYSSKPHGLGLGLSVSRSLVRTLGGRLWATPNTEGGETFSFTLPIADEA